MKLIDVHCFRSKLKASRQKVRRGQPIPRYIKEMFLEFDFASLPTDNDRAEIFLKQMKLRRISSQTITKYFHQLVPTFFPTTTLAPNALVFDARHRKHTRGGIDHNYEKFLNYLHHILETQPSNVYIWPIMIGYYTGLRLKEICSLRAKHLIELQQCKLMIELKRKTTEEWHVLYSPEFKEFIKKLLHIYRDKVENYNVNKINNDLFTKRPQTLNIHFRQFYVLATGQQPPLGFGIHSFRYYLGTKLANMGEIETARVLLGHASTSTTKKYVKQDVTHLQNRLNSIVNEESFYSTLLTLSQSN